MTNKSIKNITCTECPVGCALTVEIVDGEVRVSGNKCPKGAAYGKAEEVDPSRVLASIVRANGLEIKMVPVRTDKPIPRSRIKEAMKLIRTLEIDNPVKLGDVVAEKFLGLDVNLISTRTVAKE